MGSLADPMYIGEKKKDGHVVSLGRWCIIMQEFLNRCSKFSKDSQ